MEASKRPKCRRCGEGLRLLVAEGTPDDAPIVCMNCAHVMCRRGEEWVDAPLEEAAGALARLAELLKRGNDA